MRLGQSGTSSTSGEMELFPMICAQEIIFVVLNSQCMKYKSLKICNINFHIN